MIVPFVRADSPSEVFSSATTIRDPAPISINKAYTVYRGRKTLTAAGRKYKDAVASQIAQTGIAWGKLHEKSIYEEGGYVELHIAFFLKELFNKSWTPGGMTKPRKNKKTGKTPKPQLRNPYQQVDVSNYLKLLEDGIVQGCGVDDSSHLDIHLYKREDKEHPRIEVMYRVMI
jgi:Holliday junction resolvase RusA-like endonuclease